MLAIEFRFPAGRVHATPWGRHVNEADVAWPPDPWRLCRALIAVWHRKVDPALRSRPVLESLLAALAAAPPPRVRLPSAAVLAHSRHYVPVGGGKPKLVFDAFARVAPDDPLAYAWPALTLGAAESDLLDSLLAGIGYFGRAESWAEARRGEPPPAFDCEPVDERGVVDIATGEVHGEIVRLLVPASRDDYRRLRDAELTRLAAANAPKGLAKRVRPTLPQDWIDALAVDTGPLQAAGWSLPPAARVVAYRRPLRVLESLAVRAQVGPRVVTAAAPRTVRFAVYGKPLPRAESCLRIAERVRAAAMGRARQLFGEDAIPQELSGHAALANRHGHAFWLPEPDAGGFIDHVLVHAPAGLGPQALEALTSLRRVAFHDREPLRLAFEGAGQPAAFATETALAGRSRWWRSVTPYLHPWHMKRRELRSPDAIGAALRGQLEREWHGRGHGLPPIREVRELQFIERAGRRVHPVQFVRQRRKRGLVQADPLGRFLELAFDAPVQGPVALGFGCHFGLGLFEAEADDA